MGELAVWSARLFAGDHLFVRIEAVEEKGEGDFIVNVHQRTIYIVLVS